MTDAEIKPDGTLKSKIKRNLLDLFVMLAVFAFLIFWRNMIFWPDGHGGLDLDSGLATNLLPCYLIFYICIRRLNSTLLYLFLSILWAGLTFAELAQWGALSSSKGPLVINDKRTEMGIFYELLSPSVWIILFAISLVITKKIWPLVRTAFKKG